MIRARALLVLCCLGRGGEALGQNLLGRLTQGPPKNVKEEMVPMRDGARLATDIVLPAGSGPWPVVLTRTPYGKRTGSFSGLEPNFVAQDYARVVQDVRGRFKSEGKFGSFDHEPQDGFDTVEWIARQPWCNGKVGMFGVSAGGILANFTAAAAPPHLVCNFVCVAHGSDYRYGSFPGGVFHLDLNERWFRALGVPLAETLLPRIRQYDEDFASRDLARHYGNVRAPTFFVGGWYDIFSESTVENFEGLDRHSAPEARGKHRLTMGAFAHLPIAGKIRYPADASFPDTRSLFPWFDFWLKGRNSDAMAAPRVRYFLMGDPFDKTCPGMEWRTAASWPPAATPTPHYLDRTGRLSPSAPTASEADTFTYDPRDPVPTVGGNNLFLPRGPLDQRPLAGRADILRYVSEPLAAPVEIAGRARAELFVTTDAADTDFHVKLIDVYPDGYQALVNDQPMRLRHREGFDKSLPAKSGEVYRIDINLWSTALVFGKGHRIALHVSSSNAPRFEPHTNTWKPVRSYNEAVVAHNRVFHGGKTASRLILPVTEVHASPKESAAANGQGIMRASSNNEMATAN